MSKKNISKSVRCHAIDTLVAVQEGTSLAYILSKCLDEIESNNRGFYHELVLGTLRHWFAFVRISDSLSHYPITDKSTLAALHMGMYQLFYLRTPDHAAIGETVEAAKMVGNVKNAGLINALLRKCQKDFNKINKKISKNHSLPNWLAKQLKMDWKEYYNELSASLRQPADIFLRINPRQTNVSEYAQLLTTAQIAHTVLDSTVFNHTLIEDSIRLDDRVNIESLPHFDEGFVSVQDINAQKSVALFSDLTDKNVLDCCAAPGGKTAQVLEQFNVINLTAVDIEPNRTLRIADNLSRLGLLADNVKLISADMSEAQLSELNQQNREQGFDAILLDAPCTATGVIRRHPDICLLRQEEDVANTVQLQRKILENTWKMLKKGGELVYVTCSLFKSENCEQIVNFLANTPDAVEQKLDVDWGIEQIHGRQCLPISSITNNDGTDNTVNDIGIGDGFYFCKLIKK